MIVIGYILIGVICILGILAVIGCVIHMLNIEIPEPTESREDSLRRRGLL